MTAFAFRVRQLWVARRQPLESKAPLRFVK
jgi:hypothetical protein